MSINKSTSIESDSVKDSIYSSIPVDTKICQTKDVNVITEGNERENSDKKKEYAENGKWEVHRGRKRRNRRRNNTIQLKCGMSFKDATIKLVAEFGALVDFDYKNSGNIIKSYTGLLPAWVIRKWAAKNNSVSREDDDVGIDDVLSIGDAVDVIVTGVKMIKSRNGKQKERVRLDILNLHKQ
mmetsp:Transcript_2037/g.2921  ORF Transcript_2037/g.2921 Transcript_2037/m.2921 type:complete len:182 (+) Transcript_2037:339-884(+)